MPRWYYLLILRAMKVIIVTFMIVVGLIALCVAADWIWHLGWGYDWYAPVFLVLFALIAFAINRGLSILIRQTR